jgi:hypothetical protein
MPVGRLRVAGRDGRKFVQPLDTDRASFGEQRLDAVGLFRVVRQQLQWDTRIKE